MEVKGIHLLVVVLLIVLAGSYFGYINIQKGTITTTPTTQTSGTPYQQPTQTQIPSSTTEPSAQLYFEVTDAIAYTDVASTTDTDVAKSNNGIFNFLQLFDTKAQGSNPQAMNSMYADGSEIILHVGSTVTPTGGNGYYDGWYYTILHVGNPIYQLTYGDLSVAGTTPSYTYTVTQSNLANNLIIGYVSWTSGTTPYWNLGKLYIFPRVAGNCLTESITYQGTTLASVTDGATWVNYTTTKDTANATLASTNEQLVFNLYSNTTNLGYGFPLLTVQSNGQIVNYQTYLVMTTNMLAIGTPSGWNPLSDSTLYAEKGYYMTLGPFFAPKGQKMSFTLPIPIQSQNSAHATQYIFKFWLVDAQNPMSLPAGTMVTSIPTAYGFLYQYGITSVIQKYAYSTSSGSSATEQLYTYLTTPT